MSDKSAADFTQGRPKPLASPTLPHVASRGLDGSDEPADLGESLGERDTEPSIDAQILRNAPKTQTGEVPLEPSVREHGVWGTQSVAVGGFGESYAAQVAHGFEPDLPVDAEEAPEDAPLGREVRKTLARAHIDAAELRVAVRGHHVTLLGCVREPLEKAQIEARARAIPGVREVTNQLTVLSEGSGSRLP